MMYINKKRVKPFCHMEFEDDGQTYEVPEENSEE